jgi:transcriptional regulator GlxA family with amidase domain
MDVSTTIAIVAYQGVLADESEAFRFVLSRIPGAKLVTVGTRVGTIAGPGGAQQIDATIDQIDHPDVVAVPGGIGCHRRDELSEWLRQVSPRWLLASSTGSALVASAGLLHHGEAATHWLGGPLLERYGAHASRQRLVVDGGIVTCSGCASAFRAALVVAEAYGGPALVDRIRTDLTELRGDDPAPPSAQFSWRRRRRNERRRPSPQAAMATAILVELEERTPDR